MIAAHADTSPVLRAFLASGVAVNTFIPFLLLAAAAPAPQGSLSGQAGIELQYRGTLSQVSRQGEATEAKQFDLYILVRPAGDGHRCFYTITERGGGGWAWPERSGEMLFDDANRLVEGRPPHILQTHDGTKYPVELEKPLFQFADRLEDGRKWTSGSLAWEVQKKSAIRKRDAWLVSAADRFGRRQNLWVEAGGSLVLAAERQVVMGRGDQFQLRLELTGQRAPGADALEEVSASAEALLKLGRELERTPGELRPELSEAQIKTALAALPGLVDSAGNTPLKGLVTAITRDVRSQHDRAGDLENLARKYTNQPAPEFSLTSLARKTISSQTQKNRITVLHFWTYQGDRLEEPYGQVGYLDFLKNKRGRLGVDVIGVAVNSDFSEKQTSGNALRAVRKLRDFMNLSYPIATDAGDQIKKFGDPRSLGANLPLWVVIGHDGKVAHYHVGYYSIKPDEGLRSLDTILLGLIRKQRAAE